MLTENPPGQASRRLQHQVHLVSKSATVMHHCVIPLCAIMRLVSKSFHRNVAIPGDQSRWQQQGLFLVGRLGLRGRVARHRCVGKESCVGERERTIRYQSLHVPTLVVTVPGCSTGRWYSRPCIKSALSLPARWVEGGRKFKSHGPRSGLRAPVSDKSFLFGLDRHSLACPEHSLSRNQYALVLFRDIRDCG